MTGRMPHPDHKSLDRDIQQIAGSAQTDDEALRAWQRVFNERVALPCDGFVIGEPVSVVEFCYDGNPRRGLTARCRRADETAHVVGACDLVLPPRTAGERLLSAYRRWLGLEPFVPASSADIRLGHQHKAKASDIDLAGLVELVLLSVKDTAARCVVLGTRRGITLRSGGLWDAVPGEIIVVQPRKQWSYAGHPYLSGEIRSTRLEVSALDLVPLTLKDEGVWDPHEQVPGASPMILSTNGRSGSSPVGRGANSRWSRCCPALSPTIRSPTPSPNRTISKTPATSEVRSGS